MKIFLKIVDWFEDIFENIAVIFLVIMTLVISSQVLTRYVFSYTPAWSEELALICMIWFSFLGMAIGIKRNSHIALHFFHERLPRKAQNLILYANYGIIIFFGLFITFFGIRLVRLGMMSIMPGTKMPTSVSYFIVPVAGGLIILNTASALIRHVNKEE